MKTILLTVEHYGLHYLIAVEFVSLHSASKKTLGCIQLKIEIMRFDDLTCLVDSKFYQKIPQ